MLIVMVDHQDNIGMDLLASDTDPQALTTSTGMDAVTALNILGLDVDNQMYKNVPGVDLGKCSGGDLINKDLGLVHLNMIVTMEVIIVDAVLKTAEDDVIVVIAITVMVVPNPVAVVLRAAIVEDLSTTALNLKDPVLVKGEDKIITLGDRLNFSVVPGEDPGNGPGVEDMVLSITDVDLPKMVTVDPVVVTMDLRTEAVKTTVRQGMDLKMMSADHPNKDIVDLIVGVPNLLDSVVDHQTAIALDLLVINTDQVHMDPGLNTDQAHTDPGLDMDLVHMDPGQDTAPINIGLEDTVLLNSLNTLVEGLGKVLGVLIITGLGLDATVLGDMDSAQDHAPTIFLKDTQKMLTAKNAAKMNLVAQRIRAIEDVMEEERKMDLGDRGIRSIIQLVILCLFKESF
uniref:Uncharacterized protein n=1 Tax=Heliothis virescens TaxID=7102 RepID=A0A2A4JB19_HELVI